MPQLIPFYFVNQLVFTFVILFTIIYLITKFILPMYPLLGSVRMYITKL